MTIYKLSAEREKITEFISEITKDWLKSSNQFGMFEIRRIGEKPAFIKSYLPRDKDKAVDLIIKKNQENFNVYMTINPIDPNAGTMKAAKDKDIKCAYFCFADADDEKGIEGLELLSLKKPPDIIVNTGTVPYLRQHHYWRLTTPCTDMEKWRSYQKLIATSCGTDPSIVNPSRIMRVAGTVSYPNPKKVLRGYKPELVTMTKGAAHGSK